MNWHRYLNSWLICSLASAPLLAQALHRDTPAQEGTKLAAEAGLEERLQTELDALVARSGVPGASLAVVLADEGRIAITSGLADQEAGRKLEPGDKMLAGSTGKTFVAALALALVHEEKLGLDDAVSDWLGEESWYSRLPNAQGIHVRELLNHTSGIPEYYEKQGFVEALVAGPDRTWKPAELIKWVLDDPPLFEPGEGWSYADTNYIVLGLILERAGKEQVYAAIARRLLVPNGLGATVPSTSRRIDGLVPGTTALWKGAGLSGRTIVDGAFVIQPQFEWTGGGFASTPTDLAWWAHVLYGGRAFEWEYLPELLDSVPARTGPEERYGLGVQVFPTRFGPMHGHGGFFPGYLTILGYLPEHQLALAMQINTDEFGRIRRPLHRLLEDFAAVVLGAEATVGK